ncbi:hypothetical protein LQZ18_10440 [Lachnospiraceae bacterium ZAX-1]
MGKETLLMAVDLGTSFIKSGVYNTDSACVAEALKPVKDYRPAPGVFIQKGEELFTSVLECMKEVCLKLGDRALQIVGISFTGQMSGFMGVSSDWTDITTWSCSLDSRYMPYADRQMEELKKEFLETSGTNFPQMAPKFAWFQAEFPDEAKKIAKYLMVSGYVIGRLGNLPIEDAVMDRSFASWTGLADIRNDKWSDRICDAIGLKQEYLPKIVNSNYICGYLCEQMAKDIGMKAGVPLVSGAGDKVAGCLGAGIVNHGDMVFEASSYGEISCCVEEYRPDMVEGRLDVLASAIPGEFYATHFIAGSGITLDWFVNTFVKKENEELGEAFKRIDEASLSLQPGCDGVMAIGLLSGSSMPLDAHVKGMWMGHDWSHKQQHFYRSLLESFSYDIKLALERIEDLYPEYKLSNVKMIGGGAKSLLWPQMNADVFGKTITTLNRKDVSMWGASILAGNAVGIFGDLKATATQYVAAKEQFTPNVQLETIYGAYKGLYKEYVQKLTGFYQHLAEI